MVSEVNGPVIGEGFLARVPDSEPPEWRGETTVWSFTYPLVAHVEVRDGRNVLVVRVISPAAAISQSDKIEGFDT